MKLLRIKTVFLGSGNWDGKKKSWVLLFVSRETVLPREAQGP